MSQQLSFFYREAGPASIRLATAVGLTMVGFVAVRDFHTGFSNFAYHDRVHQPR